MSNAISDPQKGTREEQRRRSPTESSNSDGSDLSSNSDESGDFDEWIDEDGDAPIQSLLGSHTVASLSDAWKEIKEATGVDIAEYIVSAKLRDHQLVRLVNYLRSAASRSSDETPAEKNAIANRLKTALSPAQLAPDSMLWTDERWLIPVLDDDGLLMAVLAAEEEEESGPIDAQNSGSSSSSASSSSSSAATILPALGAAGSEAALATSIELALASSEPATQLMGKQLAALCAQLQSMQNVVGRLLEDDDDSGESGDESEKTKKVKNTFNEKNKPQRDSQAASASSGAGAGAIVVDSSSSSSSTTIPVTTTAAAAAASGHDGVNGSDNDSYYFDSYAGIGIHSDMLSDQVRTDSYRDAIVKNPSWFQGSTVFDCGCGTGILSLFSADAGATKVIALDASNILEEAMRIVTVNGKQDVIQCVKGKAEEVIAGLAPQSVDIIVSEWMGYALHYESMLTSVLGVRDRLLKPGGRMMPSHARIFVGAYSDCQFWYEKVAFWSNVYGYNMSNMAKHAIPEAHVLVVRADSVVSAEPHAVISAMNTCTMTASDLDIVAAPLELTIERDGVKETGDTIKGGSSSSSNNSSLVNETSMSNGSNSSIPIHGLVLWFDIDFGNAVFDPAMVGKKSTGSSASSSSSLPVVSAPIRSNTGSDENDDDDDAPPLEDATVPVPVTSAPPVPLSSSSSSSSTSNNYHHVNFSTGANVTPTHWQQTVLLFNEPWKAAKGEKIVGTFDMIRDADNPRCYLFRATIALVGATAAAAGAEAGSGGNTQLPSSKMKRFTWQLK